MYNYTTQVLIHGETCEIALSTEGKSWYAAGKFKGRMFTTKDGSGTNAKAIEKWRFLVSLHHNE